ncbi:Uncharacterized conserved protein [Slackia heliotrinireducens]|uniref:Uncharacterized conserved protein n=1 Tax=Slackia heliotrinireducens (strain ATCC 29202 / DSM 20476 / NCTC 11029 / RHS 1) TaxID=471855 RepID=C7N1M6_SLAHD|nr:hypothetical protein [Slackia heliotrinireducens]ACV21318.1 uncharacterized conserved protein [Slackia heliotrinireducens DSM 20476]VEG98753.1 Uncharacterized conserved protein [Slackia heliotrinireducens]
MPIVAAYAVPHPPLIIPSVGCGQEAGIQGTIDAYHQVAVHIAETAPDTVIVSSPHAPAYRDGFAICQMERLEGNMRQFRSPERIECNVDVQLAQAIEAAAIDASISVYGSAWRNAPMDHATFIPLYFLRATRIRFRAHLRG